MKKLSLFAINFEFTFANGKTYSTGDLHILAYDQKRCDKQARALAMRLKEEYELALVEAGELDMPEYYAPVQGGGPPQWAPESA